MANITCTNCGASTEHTAKFCRRCGIPLSFGEATTKNLDAPAIDEPRTQHVNAAPTTPSYLAPGYYPPAPALPTQGLQKARHKWTIIGLASLVLILLLALVAVLFLRERSEYEARTPIIDAPQPPPSPRVPGNIPGHPPPPLPPAPPTPGARGQGQGLGREMVYPGADIVNEVNAGPAGTVLMMETRDGIDKVFGWYEQRLRDPNIVKRRDGTSILTARGTAVVIKTISGRTSITLTLGVVQ